MKLDEYKCLPRSMKVNKHMSEPEERAINPRTGKPGGLVRGGSQGAWDPERISRDIEAASAGWSTLCGF